MMHGPFKIPKQAGRRQHNSDPSRAPVNLSLSLIYNKDFSLLQNYIRFSLNKSKPIYLNSDQTLNIFCPFYSEEMYILTPVSRLD